MFRIASWVHTFEKCASQFARRSILPTHIGISRGSKWGKKKCLYIISIQQKKHTAFRNKPKSPCSSFPLSLSVSDPKVSQFPCSVPSISWIQSFLYGQIMRCGCSTIALQCKPIYFPLPIADSIKQCPTSTQLSQREWFIAESQVFASLCEAVQCKISSFIFHIAGAASLNIPVREHWAEDSLKFKCGIKKPVPGFEECTNIIKHISSCWSNVQGLRLRDVSDAVVCSLGLKTGGTHNDA